MLLSVSEIRARRAVGLWPLLVLAASCGAQPAPVATDLHKSPAPSASAASALRAAAPSVDLGRRRVPLGEARETPIPLSIEPVQGGGSILFVSQFAGERAAWVRRLDGRTGAMGPLLELVDEHVYGAFDGSDGRFTLVTSDGALLCLATYRPDADHPEARGCGAVSPSAIAMVGERVALLEMANVHAPGTPPGKLSASASQKPRPAAKEPARPAREKKGGAAKGTANADPRPTSNRGARVAGAGKKKPAHAAASAAHRPQKISVELRIRWATRAGEIETEPRPTGLHFEAPLDGMELVDARARSPGIDLLWFETALKRKTRSPLGSARLMAGSLRADGSLDLASRVAVIDGDLDYGLLRDHRAPRLVGAASATAYVGLDAKGQCEAIRVLPTLARLTPAAALCAVAPDQIGALPAASPADIAALEKILTEDPQRTSGQTRGDPGLAAWAGDRAYFLHGGALRSAARVDGSARDEPAPFVAHRARIAWGAIAADGSGIALVGDGLAHLDAPGQDPAAAAPPAVAVRPVDGDALPGAGRAPELPVDRRRAARIGDTWWVARGDVVRVFPDAVSPPALRGAAPADAAVLVGGAARGILLEVAGEALRLSAIDAAGSASPIGGPAIVSPVRVGLDACERGGGGALVAGVSAVDAARVIAFAVDVEGHVGRPVPTPLAIRPGELAVRLTPLPGGGALLTDLARRHVVWLDDDARPVADAPAPLEESRAICLDGHPARAVIPAPTPGKFVPIPDLAAPGACVLGEPVWTTSGKLMWFGSAVSGLDAAAEARIVEVAAPPAAPAPIAIAIAPDTSLHPARAPACPSDMVSVGGRFCVDRFEAMIVDARTGEPLSPDFPTTPNLLDFVFGEWSTARIRTGGVHARAFPLPFLPLVRLGQKTEPLAISRLGVRPNGYLTGLVAAGACAAAGKRLCSLDEFVTACRGEDDTAFPYGDAYEDGVCNVFREEHPAAILHDNASVGHLDPRLNRVSVRGKPLYQPTGQSLACKSRWGSDAAYDMAGNLDEWIDEGNGAFAGGFYSRSTRAGCDALVTAHPRTYLDYSTGVRCCKSAAPAK